MTIGERSMAWRTAAGLDTEPGWVGMKLMEELGEVARAVVGMREHRPGRGDPLQEAAQSIIVLAALVEAVLPGADLMAAVEAEFQRLGG